MSDEVSEETKVPGVTLGGLVHDTSLAGYLNASYRDLVRLLGEPNCEGDGYKVSTEWKLTFKGETFTLYEYKETVLYGDSDETVAEFRARPTFDWHVGARVNCSAFVEVMKEAISQLPPLAMSEQPEPTDAERAFAETIVECEYLKGDDCQKTRSFLLGYATSRIRQNTDRVFTNEEESELELWIGEWVKS